MSITPLMPVYARCGFRPVRGEHCHLIGEDGRRYLDFASGIAVNILGHSHAGLIGAIQRQAETLMHVSNLYGSPQGEHLAQRLVELTFADTVFFTNSGAEAVECAIKTARAYHQHVGHDEKFELITFNNAFHGRTLATISASSQDKMHKGFKPLLPGFRYLEFDDLEAVRAAIGPNTAGFMLEPIQGEGGVVIPTEGYLRRVRELCSGANALMMADEIQSGLARTGETFACDHEGVVPDVYILGKALGGGIMPLSAIAADRSVLEVITPGSHGSTFGGNPLACAAALATLETIEKEGLLAHAAEMGALFANGLRKLAERRSCVRTVRGIGLMVGLVLDVPAKPVEIKLRESGLLCIATGDHVLRFVPPLVVSAGQIRRAIDLVDAAL